MDRCKGCRNHCQQVSACEKCALHFSRKKAVPGEGPVTAKVMLIGEGPGFYENEQGRPFVGPSGKFLDELLQSAGLKRPEVFITNVVKCRPPGNRDPLPDELAACRPYLEKQSKRSILRRLLLWAVIRWPISCLMAELAPFTGNQIGSAGGWLSLCTIRRRHCINLHCGR